MIGMLHARPRARLHILARARLLATCAVYASRSKPTSSPHTRATTATTNPQSYATTGVMREYGVYGP